MGTSYETLLTPETIERNEALGYWDGRILTDHFDDAVRRDPRAVSSVDSRGKLTYGELDALVVQVLSMRRRASEDQARPKARDTYIESHDLHRAQ